MSEPSSPTTTPELEKANPSVSPTGLAVVQQGAVRVLTGLVGLAAMVEASALGGAPVPPVVLNIAHLVMALGVVFGIASPGVRKV